MTTTTTTATEPPAAAGQPPEPPSPTADRDERRRTADALRELRRPVAGMTRLGVVLGAIGAVGTLVPFVGIAEIGRILLAEGPVDGDRVTAAAVVVALALVAGWSCTGAALWITHLADGRLQAGLRRRMVAKLGRVPLGWYSSTTSGQVRKAAQDDIETLHHLTAHHDVELAGAIALPVAGLGYLTWVDWRLALLALATLPVYLTAYAFMMRGFAEKMAAVDTAFGRVGAAVVEFVHGIGVVKVFGGTRRVHAGYREAVHAYGDQYAGWVRPVLKLDACTSMALSVPVISVVGLAGGIWFTHEGWVTPADVLAEVLVATVLPTTLLTLNQGLAAQREAVAAAGRITALLDVPELPVAARPRKPNGHDVVCEGVVFGYAPDRPVLRGIDLSCRAGSVTALVGGSGAGKSTLAALVPRFHDVDAGAVRIGGVDVRDIAPGELYRHVGFVLQDVQLLHGTVADNLRLGRPGATDDELVAAATAARIHERVTRLPRGYDSVVGDDARFSGGEAQRLTIARALLADAPVLVLDEATAYADPESEAEIQDALSTLVPGRTVLVVAHRLSTVTGADRIVVLDAGRIVEQGTHPELLAAEGRYARMWAAHRPADAPGDEQTGDTEQTGGTGQTGDTEQTGQTGDTEETGESAR
ncbi:ABC transporter ATP-binding protein [Streptomyces sp. enrichment culture]|uniref:ABC transporter ATP-binding protein n=1 Tax=Streptomyces sp. enrichment culture TaxID=1795815 RepID=UPI003F5681A9